MTLQDAKQHIRTLKWVAQKARSNTAEANATAAAKLLEPELFAENSPILVALDAYETKAKQGTLTPLDLYNALVLASRYELLQFLAEGVVILVGVPPLPEPNMRAFAPLIARGWDPEPAIP